MQLAGEQNAEQLDDSRKEQIGFGRQGVGRLAV
jgi:hypothetical protein